MQFFTADTHFSSERTLELSKRPFNSVEEMDETLILNFNKQIENSPDNNNKIYHLGDFGNHIFVKRIKAPIILIIGNYEEKELNEEYGGDWIKYKKHMIDDFGYQDVIKPGTCIYMESIIKSKRYENATDKLYNSVRLWHRPTDGLKYLYENKILSDTNPFFLFGHIHGRQMVKKFGLDVGVDAHHFKLITPDDILFYKNAIENHYDDDVFCY